MDNAFMVSSINANGVERFGRCQRNILFSPRRIGRAVDFVHLEPIQEEWIHEQRFGLVKRLSMMRIIARRTKAATVPA